MQSHPFTVVSSSAEQAVCGSRYNVLAGRETDRPCAFFQPKAEPVDGPCQPGDCDDGDRWDGLG